MVCMRNCGNQGVMSSNFNQNFNIEQEIVDKFTKLSKIGFSMEYYTADSSLFSNTNV